MKALSWLHDGVLEKWSRWFARRVQNVSYKPGTQLIFTLHNQIFAIEYESPDSNDSSSSLNLRYARVVPVRFIEDDEEKFKYWIKEFFRGFEHHELDEWLRIDGERLNNPHKNDLVVENTFEGGCG
jgi:hypothetical protein